MYNQDYNKLYQPPKSGRWTKYISNRYIYYTNNKIWDSDKFSWFQLYFYLILTI